MTRNKLSIYQSILFFLIINFYWLSKNPHWAALPPSSSMFAMFVMFSLFMIGLISGVEYQKLNKTSLLIASLLISIPIYGNIAEQLFLVHSVGGEMSFVDTLNISDNLMGFRIYFFEAIIFLIVARSVGEVIEKRHFLAVIYLSWIVQLIWATAQFIYFIQPDLLNSLPIKPFSPCSNGGGDCLAVTRGQGIFENPFYFSWFVLCSYLVVQILNPSNWNIFMLFSSVISLSRGFIVASLIFLIPLLKKTLTPIIVSLIIFLASGIYFQDELQFIIDLRLENDSSSDSRLLTNFWALDQFFSGNIFGIGWSVNYFTDSTYASLLLRSGLPGVASFIFVWFLFYKKLYELSKDKTVLYFAGMFFLTSFLVSGVEAQPGVLILYSLFWYLCKAKR